MEEEKKKIALFGGTFNPVHNGHINVVRETLAAGKVDEIWVMPGMQHQFDWELVDSELRVEMMEMAFRGMENVKVCREELDFPGMSDQYNTIKRLQKKYDHEFIWLTGSDLLHEFRKVYKRNEILERIDFIIFGRKGFPIIEYPGMNVLDVLRKSVSDVSSKKIRFRIFEGESIYGLVPVGVEKFIREKGLYLKVSLP